MNKNYFYLLVVLLLVAFKVPSDFKSEQLKNKRVKAAYDEKEASVKQLLLAKRINTVNIYLRVFKKERLVELWVKDAAQNKYNLLISYSFCQSSGTLGPKRREGDLQIPEGFYHINYFNPWSNFYLSLGINYPNASDSMLGEKGKLGGNIFIHGNCVTIGCIPITDDLIKELYVFAVEATNNGQLKIPVHIFPARLSDTAFGELTTTVSPNTRSFWANLKEGYDYFERNHSLPKVTVSGTGKYLFD